MRFLTIIFILLNVVASAQAADVTDHLSCGGRVRAFVIHWPVGSSNAKGLPVVMALHGGGGNAENMARMTNWNDKSDAEGFLVVYPEGTGRFEKKLLTWNAGNCCGYARDHSVNDVEFLDRLIEVLKHKYRVDPTRIFVTGLSNGGMMSYRAACELSDKIAAAAPVAGALSGTCRPKQPVSVLIIHGTADQHVLYDGGIGKQQLDGSSRKDASVSDTLHFWITSNGCPAEPVVKTRGKVVSQEYSHCKNDTTVKLFKLIDEGHTWPGGTKWAPWADEPSKEFSATDEIWKFFETVSRSPQSSGVH